MTPRRRGFMDNGVNGTQSPEMQEKQVVTNIERELAP
jgi:hypothetical protein